MGEGLNGLQDVRKQHVPHTQGRFLGPIKVIKKTLASPPFAQSCGIHPCLYYLLFAATKQDQVHTSLFHVQNYVALVLLLVLACVGSSLFDASLLPHPTILIFLILPLR